ncbi:alanine racemase [Maricaulis salignorans]|uniref:alanine racemase n=1 Tax=Maricaulis salignorans TaxID=144026 RepID=UPI003A9150FF
MSETLAARIKNSLTRRRLIIGGAGLAAVSAAALARPRDHSGPRDGYFLNLQSALIEAGITTPTLVVDKARLNANIDTLMAALPAGMGYRIVTKSLPSPGLIEHVRQRSGTHRLMTFNLPMLKSLMTRMPDTDQLLGKPLPVAAAATCFDGSDAAPDGAAQRVQWLIDTPARLAQYGELAASRDVVLRINIELDVGLHRGGFVAGETLRTALETLRDNPNLRFAGFMGYEPHIPALPKAFGLRDRARASAWRAYNEALEIAATVFDADAMAAITRNAAGSPTYRLYHDTHIANEVSVGSALVKPTDFDTELLTPHQPAAFIATPVLKTAAGVRIPGIEFAGPAMRMWDPNRAETVFIYGGHWLAHPVDPPGLAFNETFGRSSNQEMLNAGTGLDIAPDDFVFFRPSQSEAVFLQFGDIAVYDGGVITDRWSVFAASA